MVYCWKEALLGFVKRLTSKRFRTAHRIAILQGFRGIFLALLMVYAHIG